MPEEKDWEAVSFDALTPEQRAPYLPPIYPEPILDHVAKWLARFEQQASHAVNLQFTPACEPEDGQDGPHIRG